MKDAVEASKKDRAPAQAGVHGWAARLRLAFKGAMAALLAIAAPAVARAPDQPADAAVPQTRAARPALWMVRDEDTTVYLFGTIHVLKPGIDWQSAPVRAAFAKADTLALEIAGDDPDATAALTLRMGIDADGPPLSDKLDAAARARYQATAEKLGLPWQRLESFKPWLVGITLAVAPLQKLGYDRASGVEQVLTGQAKAAGKAVIGLETTEQQLGYFDTLPEPQQIAFLNSTVSELPDADAQFAALIDAWSQGRPERLAEEMNESLEATPELAQRLLFDRNARWAQWIKARMATPGTVFVAVGAGHLAGRHSVQDELAALGIKARRIDR
jgi:hypothetical protein